MEKIRTTKWSFYILESNIKLSSYSCAQLAHSIWLVLILIHQVIFTARLARVAPAEKDGSAGEAVLRGLGSVLSAAS